MDRLLRAVRPNRHPRSALRGAPPILLAAGLLVALAATTACTRTEAAALSHTFDSPEQLARAVAGALERRDLAALQALQLTEQEFRAAVWPSLPASRPERNVPFGFVWSALHEKSRQYLAALVGQYGGQRLDVVRVQFRGETTDYGTFVVHRDAEVVVRDAQGAERPLRLFGSVLVRGAEHKLFSYVVD